MDAISNKSTTRFDNEQQEFRYHSYILRIWKTDEGTFKGYVPNPLTNQTYPGVNVTKLIFLVDPPLSKGVVLEPLGCSLGMWDPKIEDKAKDGLLHHKVASSP